MPNTTKTPEKSGSCEPPQIFEGRACAVVGRKRLLAMMRAAGGASDVALFAIGAGGIRGTAIRNDRKTVARLECGRREIDGLGNASDACFVDPNKAADFLKGASSDTAKMEILDGEATLKAGSLTADITVETPIFRDRRLAQPGTSFEAGAKELLKVLMDIRVACRDRKYRRVTLCPVNGGLVVTEGVDHGACVLTGLRTGGSGAAHMDFWLLRGALESAGAARVKVSWADGGPATVSWDNVAYTIDASKPYYTLPWFLDPAPKYASAMAIDRDVLLSALDMGERLCNGMFDTTLQVTFDPEGMHYVAADSERHAMISIDLPASAFRQYAESGERMVSLDIVRTVAALRRMCPGTVLLKRIKDLNTAILSDAARMYAISMPEIAENVKYPAIAFPLAATAVADASDVLKAVRIIEPGAGRKRGGKEIDISIGKGLITVGDSAMPGDEHKIAAKTDGSAFATYNARFLKEALRVAGGSTTFGLTDNKPLKMEWGHAKFWLAPVVR